MYKYGYGYHVGKIQDGALLNPAIPWIIPITGRTSGTATAGTLTISCIEDITITSTGGVTVSIVQAADSIYRQHTITVNCPNNQSGTIIIPDKSKVIALGSVASVDMYAGSAATIPILSINFTDAPPLNRITQIASYLSGIAWSGVLTVTPALKFCWIQANSNAFTVSGDFASDATAVFLSGAMTYASTSAIPSTLTVLNLESANMNWVNSNFSGTGNFTIFRLLNWRTTKITSAEMVTILTSLTNRIGSLPASITINDYVDYASPPIEVTNAVAALKAAKPVVTTVNLGA